MKRLIGIVLGLVATGVGATPYVTNVVARQRFPWNGLVDIKVTLVGAQEDCAAAAYAFYVTNKTTKAELPIRSVSTVGSLAGSGDSWTRRFVWNATADVGRAKFGEVMLTVGKPSCDGVQLWENGPYWAECNVGATKPEEYGYYFWWGDTVGYKLNAGNSWVSVKDGKLYSFYKCPTLEKDNSSLQSAGYIDSTGNLAAAHDAATAHLGVPWRMPTDAEVSALISNCTSMWIISNGVPGRLVIGKGVYASNSIFLPAAGCGFNSSIYLPGSCGYYWSSTPISDSSKHAWSLCFASSEFDLYSRFERNDWQTVRPVRGYYK